MNKQNWPNLYNAINNHDVNGIVNNVHRTNVGRKRNDWAEKMGVRFLGEVPLHIDIRTHADEGKPIVEDKPESPQAAAYMEIAKKLV